MELVQIGIQHSFLNFGSKTYKSNEKCLAIGGYESGFLSEIVMSFLMKKSLVMNNKQTKFAEIYRDDMLILADENLIEKWLKNFLEEMETLSNNRLKWTREKGSENGKQIVFLDLKIDISKEILKCTVFNKKKLEYINSSSCHVSWQIRNIGKSQAHRLNNLTIPKNTNVRIYDFYPEHKEALKQSNIPVPNTKFSNTTIELFSVYGLEF